MNSFRSTTDSQTFLADFLWNIQPLNNVSVIPKIQRVPKTIHGSLQELLDRKRQFEIAVLANPQAGSTEDERVIFNKKLGYRGEPKEAQVVKRGLIEDFRLCQRTGKAL
ncbi:hypothetical protein PCASD_17762 [Puccinia coronata f. sp. avenae]|uniref:Uncharacterized protein n=1 Tax=Puccinia coronata f. sp. avenae TaxID=200324 RepID=A0A2N5TYN7_9BASI|nr:hypothetical protein PCASD_17762 [Puccinia coronata f. sp. avenae]